MQTAVDRCAYRSKLAAVRVRDKLLFCIPPLIISLITENSLLHLAVVMLMVPATLYFSGISRRSYCKLLLVPGGFLLISLITVLITSLPEGEKGLLSFSLPGLRLGISADSVYRGLLLFSRAFASICCLYFLSLTTPMNNLLSFLRRVHVPSLLVDLMELIYRFIFTLWDEASRIRLAQETRLGYRGIKSSFQCLGQLVSGVLISAVGRADRIRLCLESRGFNGNFDSLCEPEQPANFLWITGLCFTACLALTALLTRL